MRTLMLALAAALLVTLSALLVLALPSCGDFPQPVDAGPEAQRRRAIDGIRGTLRVYDGQGPGRSILTAEESAALRRRLAELEAGD